MPTVARFYLALNLENYDQRYDQALQAIEPLVEKYPSNPTYQLVRGDLNAKLGWTKQAEVSYRAALASLAQIEEPQCRASIEKLAKESLKAIAVK